MIAAALRDQIERYAFTTWRENPLYRGAERGTLSRAVVVAYLANLHHLVLHTPVHLRRAQEVAARRGDAKLAKHYAHRLGEEEGHDAWAASDLAGLGSSGPSSGRVVPAMRARIASLEAIIDEDPTLYLAYILVAEYLTVLVGPGLLAMLEERCGISRSSMSVIGNHAELDREHVTDALDAMDDLVADPRKLARMRRVVDASLALFDAMCVELCALGEERAHAPAA